MPLEAVEAAPVSAGASHHIPHLLPPLAPILLPQLQIGSFEGPLDLLLHLVRQGRMDIFDLPIALLCDQYLGYLNAMEAFDLAVAGDFLVMAATLLEIKSRLMLPAPPRANPPDDTSEPEDPRAELVRRLLDYGRFQTVADSLRDFEGDRRQLFFRSRAELDSDFRLPPKFGELSADALLRTLEKMLATVGAGEKQITSVRRQKITLRMKMREVLTAAEREGEAGIALDTLLPEPPFVLLDIVLIFLALLELLKAGSVRVFQDTFCGEIRIFAVSQDAETTDTMLDSENTEGFARDAG